MSHILYKIYLKQSIISNIISFKNVGTTHNNSYQYSAIKCLLYLYCKTNHSLTYSIIQFTVWVNTIKPRRTDLEVNVWLLLIKANSYTLKLLL